MAVTDIADEVERREIKRICHFTRSESLARILECGGILSTTWMLQYEIRFVKNDHVRHDHREGHIACTIQYPNVFLMDKWRQVDGEDWVVISIDPDPIWAPDTLFSPVNAATESGAMILAGVDGFQEMFTDNPRGSRFSRKKSHEDCSPTDLQAEVLVHGMIETELFRSIIVADKAQASRERQRLAGTDFPENLRLAICPEYFDKNLVPDRARGLRTSPLQISFEHF